MNQKKKLVDHEVDAPDFNFLFIPRLANNVVHHIAHELNFINIGIWTYSCFKYSLITSDVIN